MLGLRVLFVISAPAWRQGEKEACPVWACKLVYFWGARGSEPLSTLKKHIRAMISSS